MTLERPPIKLNLSLFLGLLCLVLSTYLGYVVRFVGLMGDEGDTMAAANLITQGYVLYRDIFSHHFPFSYYWVALAFGLFGPSIAVARLSILAFQLIAFAVTMIVTRRPWVVGMVALLWTGVGYFYVGNLALYQSLSAIALMPILLIVYFILTKQQSLTYGASVLIAIFSLCAISANPLMLFPIGVALLCLVASKPPLRPLALLFGPMVAGGLLYGGYLVATNSIADFWDGAFTFNVDYYGRYSQAPSENYIVKILVNAGTLLHLVTPDRAMFPIEALQTLDPATRWLLSEQFGKLAIIGLTLVLVRRHPLAALFVYGVAAAALFRGRTNFDHLPFLAVAIAVIPLFWTVNSPIGRWQTSVQGVLRGGVIIILVWMLGGSLVYLTQDASRRDYATTFAFFDSEATTVRTLLCGTPAHVTHYPGNPYLLFLVGAPPVSRYLFMLPWVADRGMDEELAALKAREYAVVVFRKDQEVWGRPASSFLEPLYTYVTTHYSTQDQVYYLSPKVQQACDVASTPTPP